MFETFTKMDANENREPFGKMLEILFPLNMDF